MWGELVLCGFDEFGSRFWIVHISPECSMHTTVVDLGFQTVEHCYLLSAFALIAFLMFTHCFCGNVSFIAMWDAR